jgi:hypothetical protein
MELGVAGYSIDCSSIQERTANPITSNSKLYNRRVSSIHYPDIFI